MYPIQNKLIGQDDMLCVLINILGSQKVRAHFGIFGYVTYMISLETFNCFFIQVKPGVWLGYGYYGMTVNKQWGVIIHGLSASTLQLLTL